MKIVMDIYLSCGSGGGIRIVRKVISDSKMVPFPGMYIEDSAWKDPKLPVAVTCSFSESYYHVQFETVHLSSQQACDQEVEMYRGHGWKPVSEWPLY